MSQGGLERGDQHGLLQVPVAGAGLLALLVLITISSILMGQAAETWQSQIQHETEQDLIFRGEEYKRGIEAYQKANGHPPVKLEDLCPKEKGNPRYVRRCWTDPMTGKEFRLLGPDDIGQKRAEREAREAEEEGGSDEPAGGGRQRDARDGRRRDRDRDGGGPPLSDFRESLDRSSGDEPFIGVASDQEGKAFVTYMDTEYYNEWDFYAPQPRGATGAGGGGTGGGGTGGGGTGGGGMGGGGMGGGGGGARPGPVSVPGATPGGGFPGPGGGFPRSTPRPTPPRRGGR